MDNYTKYNSNKVNMMAVLIVTTQADVNDSQDVWKSEWLLAPIVLKARSKSGQTSKMSLPNCVALNALSCSER